VTVPPIEHIIYIPAVMLLGIVIGFIMGSRAVRAEMERKRKRARE
jgi:hypothetical protein